MSENSSNSMSTDTSEAEPKRKRPQKRMMHGHYSRVRRRYGSIDKRTRTGKKVEDWRRWAITQKGNGSCPVHIRREIDLCSFDLWLLLELGEAITEDARKRGTPLNLRRKTLPHVHQQYNQVSDRFARRCEALKLDDNGQLDLARRLTQQAGPT